MDGCDPITGEYYLERNSRIADHIVDFFATGGEDCTILLPTISHLTKQEREAHFLWLCVNATDKSTSGIVHVAGRQLFVPGSLHKPQNMCIEKFKEELAYWRISHDHVGPTNFLQSGTISTQDCTSQGPG